MCLAPSSISKPTSRAADQPQTWDSDLPLSPYGVPVPISRACYIQSTVSHSVFPRMSRCIGIRPQRVDKLIPFLQIVKLFMQLLSRDKGLEKL